MKTYLSYFNKFMGDTDFCNAENDIKDYDLSFMNLSMKLMKLFITCF